MLSFSKALSLTLVLSLLLSNTTHTKDEIAYVLQLPNSTKEWMLVSTVGTALTYYAWLKSKAPTNDLKEINGIVDYFLNAQVEFKKDGEFDLIKDEDGNITKVKIVKYPSHGFGGPVTFVERFAKYTLPLFLLPIAIKKYLNDLNSTAAMLLPTAKAAAATSSN